MENFIDLLSEVWNRGFLGINLGAIISSLIVILIALLFRGFIISVIIFDDRRIQPQDWSSIVMINVYYSDGFLKTRKRAFRLVVSAGIFCIFLGGSAILPGERSQVFAKTKDVESELETEEQWLPFVGEFRERHNFAVLLGGGRSVWNIENFGRLKGKSVQNDFVHLFFNGIWSVIFFGFHKIGLALIDLLIILIFIILLMKFY